MSSAEQLSASVLLELVESQRFGVEYQPIIGINNQEIFGYECLSRFFTDDGDQIRPDLVYDSLHANPLLLFQVEMFHKQLQLKNAPDCKNLFVNLDQGSYSASGLLNNSNPFLQLFKNHTKSNIVVELIENSQLIDAQLSLSMIASLKINNISTALDDLFGPGSMVSTTVLHQVNFIKLDKYILQNINDVNFIALVESIVHFAHKTGQKVILEGVETEDDQEFAKVLGVDFVQGFLYKNLFINVPYKYSFSKSNIIEEALVHI